jgi:HAMP domain-containing protein
VSRAHLFAEAIATAVRLGQALAVWLLVGAVLLALLSLAVAAGVWRAWTWLHGRLSAERAARAVREGQPSQRPPGARTGRRAPRLGPHTTNRQGARMTDIHDFQDRGDSARRAQGIDGTAGDAQDIHHRFVLDQSTGGCLLCGLAKSYRKHTA